MVYCRVRFWTLPYQLTLETDVNPTESRILVVEDYPDLRRLTVMMLNGLGYPTVETAGDGVEALERLRISRYHFVLSDVNMPRMNGFMLLRAIKSDAALCHLPVLIMSTHPEEQYSEAAILCRAVGYLMKPFLPAALDGIIKRALADLAEPHG